jgi:dethiobiotin synthetase
VRPRLLAVVTGTGTEVGKTWVAVEVIRRLSAKGLTVSARKPAQSYTREEPMTDADLLAAASGETPAEVCPLSRWYPVPMAPPMAAELLGLPAVLLGDLEREVGSGWPLRPVDVGIVEGAGGVASPIAVNGDTAELARCLAADVAVVVARADLGAINSVRLSHDALAPLPVVVHLNRFDPDLELHSRTLEWLATRDGLSVTTDVADLVELILARMPERKAQ